MTSTSSIFSLTSKVVSKIIVFTATGPDDRMAIEILENKMGDKCEIIYMVCMRNPNIGVKRLEKQLAEHKVDRAVLAGSESLKQEWHDPATDPAIKFEDEKAEDYDKDKHLQNLRKIADAINASADNSVAIIIMTTPIDFVRIIHNIIPQKIFAIYNQGGENENGSCGSKWSFDVKATKTLLSYHQVHEIPMLLLTIKSGASMFPPEGVISTANYPEVIKVLKASTKPGMMDIVKHTAAVNRWLRTVNAVAAAKTTEESASNYIGTLNIMLVTAACEEKINMVPVIYKFTDAARPICQRHDTSNLFIANGFRPDAVIAAVSALV